MIRTIRMLPFAIAATLSLAACGKHDDGAVGAATGEQTGNEEISTGEAGEFNAVEAEGNVGDANAAAPVDDAIAGNRESLGNGG